jgi:hypothetical protein
MAQEMYKHDALLHLVWAIAKADEPITNVWSSQVSNEEKEYWDKIKKAEGIEINLSDFIDKRISLSKKYGWDSIIEEALKATNGCGKEWKAKAIVYMIRMACKSWEGRYKDDGDKLDISANEYAIYNKAREYFGLTDEEEKKGWELTRN